jgi:uncharacterized repeat protein (TIGR03803 family)
MTRSRNYGSLSAVFRSTIAILSAMLVLALIAHPQAQAQTYAVIHNFTGTEDGGDPTGGLTVDASGTIYGTTFGDFGGRCGTQCGTVFKMKNTGRGWILSTLYKFAGGADGANPWAGVVFGPDGALYGTTEFGGYACPSDDFNESGCGLVYRLTPPPAVCNSSNCRWRETVLYNFLGDYTDGAFPMGRVAFDQDGNIYGTTLSGGHFTPCVYFGWCGTIYKLTRSNGSWTESLPYRFTGGSDGASPYVGPIRDAAGNFYGVATFGGSGGNGTVFQLTPSGLNTLVELPSNASEPQGELIFDPAGNLFGTTADSQNGGGAAVFELTPSAGGWNFSLVYSLGGEYDSDGPTAGVVRDSAGNLYGITHSMGSYYMGTVFKLTPSDGGWTYTLLHEFSDEAGGEYPEGGLALDAHGNLYGTA